MSIMNPVNPVSLFAFVEQSQRIKDEVCVAERLNARRKLFRGFLKLERAAGNLHHSLKAEISSLTITLGVDNPAFVEPHLAFLVRAADGQYAIQSRVFDDLNGVENTDGAQIAGKREMFAFEVCFGCRRRLQVRPPGSTDRFETTGNIYSRIELLGFEQAIMCGVE